MYICQMMHFTFQDTLNLSLSDFNSVLKHLYLHPPLELMVSSYMGIKYGENTEKVQSKQTKDVIDMFGKMDIEKFKKKTKLTDSSMIERAKKLYEKNLENINGNKQK